jgi:hypothetical protein
LKFLIVLVCKLQSMIMLKTDFFFPRENVKIDKSITIKKAIYLYLNNLTHVTFPLL